MPRVKPHTHANLNEGGKLDPDEALRGGLAQTGGGSVVGGGPGSGDGGTTDTSDFVTKTDGGLETVEAHGSVGSTETLDLADGNWHSLTLNADCTVTVTGFTAAAGCSALVKVTQDGSGGHAIVWDADIVWASDDQPAQDPDTVSWFVLASDEGDGTIYGFPVGGSGTPAAEDVTFTPAGTIAATDVQAAIEEVATDAAAALAAHAALAVSSATDHEHILNVVFSGDASTTVWELPAAPVAADAVAVYVAGARTIAWVLSGALLTTLTFDSAPASAASNIVIDIVAATA